MLLLSFSVGVNDSLTPVRYNDTTKTLSQALGELATTYAPTSGRKSINALLSCSEGHFAVTFSVIDSNKHAGGIANKQSTSDVYSYSFSVNGGADAVLKKCNGASVFDVSSDTSWIQYHSMNIGAGFENVYLQVDSVEPASGVTYFPTKEYDKNTGILTIYFGNKTSNYFQSLKGSVVAF